MVHHEQDLVFLLNITKALEDDQSYYLLIYLDANSLLQYLNYR